MNYKNLKGNAISKGESRVNYCTNFFSWRAKCLKSIILFSFVGFLLIIQNQKSFSQCNAVASFLFTQDNLNTKTVIFTDMSTFSTGATAITSWSWNFGTGATPANSTLQNPTCTFADTTSRYVILTIMDDLSCSHTDSVLVTPSCEVYAVMTVLPDNFNYKNILFTDGSFSNYAPINSWNWNFGDGSTSILQNPPSHLYADTGTYNVLLTVSNTQACTSRMSEIVPVFCTLNPGITYETDSFNYKKLNFTENSGDLSINSWEWFWGDGSAKTVTLTPNAVHTFPSDTAPYVVYVKVNTANGCTAKNDPMPIQIMCDIWGQFSFLPDILSLKKLHFKDDSYSNMPKTSWKWNFDDGAAATSNLANPNYTFPSDTTYYNVCLRVTNTQLCTTNTCQVIKPGCNLEGFFSYNADVVNNKKLYFNYDTLLSSSPITNYFWKFGDGTFSNLANPNHIYATDDWFEACLTIKNALNCSTTYCQWVKSGCNLNAGFNYSSDTANINLVQFTDYSWSDAAIIGRKWNFGDGTPASIDTNPNHIYANVANYNVCLTLINDKNCTTSTCQWISVGTVSCSVTWNAMKDTVGTGAKFSVASNNAFVTNIYWDFGDGTSSNERNPYHVYTDPGYYTVCISAYDSITGCWDSYCNHYLAGFNPATACAAFFKITVNKLTNTVYLSDSSLGNATNRFWDFGDGQFASVKNIAHTYTYKGFYWVKLTVYDSISGCQAEHWEMVDLSDTMSCNAYFGLWKDNSTVYFNNYSLGMITDVHWDFGDGYFSNLSDPVHTYMAPGYYNVCLTVYDTMSGCFNHRCDQVIIFDPNAFNCYANFTFMPNDSTDKVYFNDESFGSFTDFFWDFGDGTTSDLQNPNHQYSGPGYYEVCLSVYDSISTCQATWCNMVVIYDPATYNCYTDFNFFIDTLDNSLYLYDQSYGYFTDYYWEFGDGSTSTDADAVHIYAAPGWYQVCLTTFDSVSGCQSGHCDWVEIYDPTYISCYSNFTTYIDNDSNTVYFTNESGGDITDFHWDMGDGTTSDQWEPVHTYSDPGYYHVCLSVYDSISGCDNYFCEMVVIYDPATYNCFADFSFFPDTASNTVSFYDQSFGYFTDYYWDFGDGESSTDLNPDHIYTYPGWYYVSLTTYDSVSGCQSYHDAWVEIYDPNYISCRAFFYTYVDADSNQVYFTNESDGAFTDFHWDMGDGTTSDQWEPIHTYSDPGYYEVCLSVYDSISGCDNYYCDMVSIYDPATYNCFADFSFYPDTASNTVSFNDHSFGYFTDYYWDFGDGEYSTDLNPDHIYTSPGWYYVSLTTYDSISGCQSYHDAWVEIYDPNYISCRAFFYTYVDVDSNQVYFTNESDGAFTDFYWDMGDGTTSDDWEPVHSYADPGYYHVCLTVWDSVSGCMEYYCDMVSIYDPAVDNCFADFSFYPDTVANTVNFSNESFGSFTDYFWDFGDGYYASVENPVHSYTDPGYYYVCLTTYDSVSGCQNWMCKDVALLDPNTVDCYAEFVSYVDPVTNTAYFTNNSIGAYTDVYWDLGDGSVSDQWDAEHTYSDPGYYEVCLSTWDSVSGCIGYYCDWIFVEDQGIYDCYSFYTVFPDPGTNTVHFVDQSYGNPDGWYWDMGDESLPDTNQNPLYTYAEPGIYEVCLTIWNSSGCQETFCDVIVVNGGGSDCYARFSYYADSVTATAYFNNTSLGLIKGYEWTFGDDTSFVSVQKNPSHTYPGIGVYAGCLTVYNDSGCVSTYCDYINIGNDLQDKCEFSCVWPGDANNDLEANHYDLLPVGLNFNEMGPERDSVSTRWIGHFAQDWSTYQIAGINNKHGDCNGDGVIDITDVDAITQNFAYSHPPQNKTPNPANPDLYFEVVTPTIAPGTEVEVKVMAGKDTDVTMYGIGFDFELPDASVNMSSARVEFNTSWLGVKGVNLLTYNTVDPNPASGKVYGSLVRNNHVNAVGKGEIAKLFFKIDSSITTVPPLTIKITTSSGGINATGDTVAFNSGQDTTINPGITEKQFGVNELILYPNPSEGTVIIILPPTTSKEYNISVENIVGQEVINMKDTKGGEIEMNLIGLQNGVYMIKVVSSDGIYYQQKLQLIK